MNGHTETAQVTCDSHDAPTTVPMHEIPSVPTSILVSGWTCHQFIIHLNPTNCVVVAQETPPKAAIHLDSVCSRSCRKLA